MIKSSNPLKDLLSVNISPRRRAHNNQKQKLPGSRLQIGNKYYYCPNQMIGDGLTSKVYKGYEIQCPNKAYAVKVIEKKRLNEDQMKLVRTEIQLHPKLEHQNIARCYDVYDTQKILYIVLQLCPHGDLSKYIAQVKDNAVTQVKAIQLMQQIIQGYKYLIRQGVLHRDLKPPNILISGKKLKIADFGFAVKGKKTLIDSMSVGTPLYMPPQSIQECVYSHKSDFFALGCIMYEMVHGKTPWYKSQQKQLVKAMKSCQINLSKVKDHNIREFIQASCQISQGFRMSIDQFLNFDFRKADLGIQINIIDVRNPQSARNVRGFLKQQTDCRGSCKQSLQQTPKSTRSNKKSQTAMQATFTSNHVYFKSARCQETKKITFQFQQRFQICLLLKYLLLNSQLLLLEQFDKKNLRIVLFRHCIFILKRLLADFIRTKSYNPKNWDSLKQSKQFRIFEQQCKSMKEKMEKDFNLQLKGMSLKNLAQINKRFPQLCYQYKLSKNFYEKLREFLRQIIRKICTQITNKCQKSSALNIPVSKNLNSQYFETFNSLYRYYENNERNLNQDLDSINNMTAFNSGSIKTSMTTKNSSRNDSESSSTLSMRIPAKKDKKSLITKQTQPNFIRKVSQNHHYDKYLNYLSPQSQRHSTATSPRFKYSINLAISRKLSIQQPNQQYSLMNNQSNTQRYCHYLAYNLRPTDKLHEQHKSNFSKKQTQKNRNDAVMTVQDHFADVLCRNYQDSKMTKEQFVAIKKKIKWL